MKRTVPQLANFLSELTGLSESQHQQQARRAREAGYLSQAGHGRGAAAAKPMDAAMMILIAAVGLSSRYAEVIAAALVDAVPDRRGAGPLVIDGDNAVEMVANLIEARHGIGDVRVSLHPRHGFEVSVNDDGSGYDDEDPEAYESGYIKFTLPEDSPSAKRLFKVQNRVPVNRIGLHPSNTLEPWVFEEIAKFLGIEWDEAAAE